MRQPYEWTTDDDEVAFDAIIVGIGDDSPALEAAGLFVPEVSATLYWADWFYGGDKIHASSEGSYPVPEALKRAEHLRDLWGFNRVVITMQRRETWNPAWGQLRELEGYD